MNSEEVISKNRQASVETCRFLVPVTGVEPVRCCHRGILSPLRLPIPPHRHIGAGIPRSKNLYDTSLPIKSLTADNTYQLPLNASVRIKQGQGLKIDNIISLLGITLSKNGHFADDISARLVYQDL